MEEGRDGHRIVYTSDIELLASKYAADVGSTSSQSKQAFADRLRSFGMLDHQITVLIDRFVHDKTLAEITEDNGFTSPGITYYVYRKALEELKRKGFGKKKTG